MRAQEIEHILGFATRLHARRRTSRHVILHRDQRGRVVRRAVGKHLFGRVLGREERGDPRRRLEPPARLETPRVSQLGQRERAVARRHVEPVQAETNRRRSNVVDCDASVVVEIVYVHSVEACRRHGGFTFG